MNCIIVEDQAPAQRILTKYITDVERLNLVGTFNNPIEAAAFIAEQQVDLIFLDIHLPKISGIDFLKTLRNPPAVIFTTAFSEYAVVSYELDVVDYLLKPFSFERFLKALNKVQSVDSAPFKSKVEQPQFFFIKSGHEYVKVNAREIQYIHSDMDYTEVILKDGTKILSTETLSSWLEKLAPLNFIRVHKSYLVNYYWVEKIAGKEIVLKSSQTIPLGRAYKPKFLEILSRDHNK